MKRTIFLAAILIVALCSFAHAYDDKDFQIWNTDVQEFKINDDLKVALEEEFRWADNANEFFYHHYDAGLSYALNKAFSVGGGYRHIYDLKKGKFKQENSPYLIATLFWNSGGFKLDDRSRLEYRHFGYQTDSWRYRNKLSVKFPWKFTKLEIQPLVSDEVLFGFGAGKNSLSQNRFSPGLAMNLTKSLKGEIYYMLVTTKTTGKWSDVNVLGTKFKLSF